MRFPVILLSGLAATMLAGPAAGQGLSHAERYTKAQTTPPPATAKIVKVGADTAEAPRVTRTYSYGEPAYRAGAPLPEVAGVKVFRSGYAGPSRPCSWQSSTAGVTTYSGCLEGYAYGLAGGGELAGGRPGQMAEPSEYLPVIGVERGICDRKIQRRASSSQRRTRYDVCFADLQPVTGKRVERLYDRVETAARRACGPSAGYGASTRRGACMEQAVDNAVYGSGVQALVDYHLTQTDHSPQVILRPVRP
ncbi:UrcA family protein [Henriciella aquimarina]|uniref:UrcA family protein n=1 Tax=Henriciella aquimarina TaxID=545261 RepID=UPI0009FD0889|nr:UrcA family protein [Henriciella aquimarina]